MGAAAAIAAAFNTPMAAVLFSLEEVMGDMHAPILGSVVIASATSWAVLRLLLGDHPLFQVPQYTLVHPLELAIYALLGIAGGFLSVAFTRLLLAMREFFLQLPKSTRWCHPVVGGVTVGLMGLVCAPGPGRWLQLCRQRPQRYDGAQVDAAASGAQAIWSHHQLRLRQCRWNLRP